MASLHEEQPLQQTTVPQVPMPMDGQGSTATSVTSEEVDIALEPQEGDSIRWPTNKDSDASSVGTVGSSYTWEVADRPHTEDPTSDHIVRDIVQNIEQGSTEAGSSSSQSQATRPPVSPRS